MDPSRFDRLTRHLGRRASRRTAVGASLAALALGGRDHLATAQNATPAPGATPAAEEPVFMFVQTAASGRGDVAPAADGTPTPGGGASLLLTLEGHTGLTVYFSDRPVREVGATPTGDFLAGLGFTPANPPNAALVGEFPAGQGVVVLQLVEPAYDADTGTLTYGAEVLDGYRGRNLEPVTREQLVERLPAEFGPAALFIDGCAPYTTCYLEVGGGYAPIGPLPGAPYAQCWDASTFRCHPCDYTVEYLDGLCQQICTGCFAS